MNFAKRLLVLVALALGLAAAPAAFADSTTLLSEDFTGATSSNSSGVGNWLFFNGACLTAGTATSLASPAASIPACTTVLNSYYIASPDHDQYLMGGANGFLGGTSAPGSPTAQVADPVGQGALRFTNGKPYGNQQRGAIVSTNSYPTSSGIQVTFKTVTYGGTGADGISFYLMDGCVPVSGAVMPAGCTSNPIYPSSAASFPAIGATGGSLAYTCSNTNGPPQGVTYDGLTGGYLGLGIDEYGNFLNQGDNTSSGYGFQAGRIGLRGAGAISWPALNNAYGSNPGASTKPFYPAYLSATCSSGVLDTVSGTCGVCPVIGPTSSTTGMVTTSTSTSTTYTGGQCANTTTTTTTTADTGCTSSGYALKVYGASNTPICVKTSSCATYSGATDATYPTGVCTFTPKTTTPTLTCNSGSGTADTTLHVCGKAPQTNTNFSNSVGTSTALNNTAPSSSVPYTPNTTAIENAVQKTCSSGHLWNYSNAGSPTDAGTATLTTDPTTPNVNNTANILDYAPIPSAYTILPTANPLFNGSATTRAQGRTIFYNLKITSDGFLSLSYAYNGGTYQTVIANQSIKNANGPLPAYVRFGFAGSTGGATNVHEIMCFKSAPAVTSGSSAGVNEKQSAKVESGTFAYFAFYDQNNWIGRVTANALTADATTGAVTVASQPAWDASCDLTGVLSGQTCTTGTAGPTAATTPASRVIMTYNAGGVPFEWSNLSSVQQAALTQNDASPTAIRLNYLRGDRTNEVNSAGTCSSGVMDTSATPKVVCFRARTSVLGDIVDSSPTWVGPPQLPYTGTWHDTLYSSGPTPENSGTQSYQQFVTAEQTRPNIVYVGSNDGMMHGFRSGAFDASGTFTTATTPNDGQEVIAYMPGSLMSSTAVGAGGCTSLSSTGSVVQNIHGMTPSISSNPACVTPGLDFSGTQYGHNFFMDATPGTGDLFYNGTWHTWLVSGQAGGGSALFALDVSDPTATTFAETNAGSVVVGEWNSSNITCVSNSSCGNNLGNTYGTPIIRRLHDGNWAVIFGNGFGSTSGDAGVFVMTVDATTGAKQFYYLSTGNTGTAANNGIAYVSSADLDGDHITDYLYAGDLMGNLWRFDLTSATESSWAVSTGPLFTTPTGQPITTSVVVAAGPTTAGGNTLIVTFGTGLRNQFNNASLVTYQTGTQAIYGVWDWNLSGWNSKSATQYASLNTGASGLSGPNYTMARTNLQAQTFTLNADGSTRDILSPTAICWAGTAACTAAPKFGWYLNLIGTQEQIVFNPQLLGGVFTVNSIVPANNTVNSCTTNSDTGFTYALSVLTGAASPNFFISYNDSVAGGVQLGAVGTSSAVTSPNGSLYLVYQTFNNVGGTLKTQLPPNGKGKRLTWVQLR